MNERMNMNTWIHEFDLRHRPSLLERFTRLPQVTGSVIWLF